MNAKKIWLNLAIAFVFISVASLTLSVWTTQYTYLHFKSEETFYLSGTYDFDDRSISEEVFRTKPSTRSIDIPLREGTIIEARTELINGDIDVDLALQIQVNASYISIPIYSLIVNSSNEKILWENKIKVPFELKLSQLFPSGRTYPNAQLLIIPVTGNGIVRLTYEVLQPVPEVFYVCILGILSSLTLFIANFKKKSHTRLEKKQKTTLLDLLLASFVIGLVVIYFSIRNMNLFFYTIILELIIISFILLAISFRRNSISQKNSREMVHLIIFVAISLLLILFSSIFVIVLILLTTSIFLLGLSGKINRIAQIRIFSILLVGAIILICSSLATMILQPVFFSISVSLIIEGVLSFIFINVLFQFTVLEEMPRKHKRDLLEQKIAEAFDEKFCDFHSSSRVRISCPACGNEICDLCLVDYENLCIFCYRNTLENRALLGDLLQRLGFLLLFVFFIFYIMGLFAPLPLVQGTLSWLGFVYARFTILMYFITISMILSIVFIGGGSHLSRVIKMKIKNIEFEIENSLDMSSG